MSSHHSKNNKFDFDLLIVGAGLVGASLVCALEPLIRQYQLRCALVEPLDLDEPKEKPPSFDARASALSYGTQQIYHKLGLWQCLDDQAESIRQVHVSDKGHFGFTRLSAEQEHVPALGYVIHNYRLGDVLLERLQQYRQEKLIDVFSPEQVTSLKPVAGGMEVGLSSVTTGASLVVLADGGRSGLMDQLGIVRESSQYHQHALITNLALDRPHNGIAYERFSGKGPMALLPLKGDQSALVWTVQQEDIDRITNLDDKAFLKAVQEQFGYRAGCFKEVGMRHSYPLSMSIAQEQVRPGLVVLGNAAHALHPVAGQGYNLAIRDVMALANNIAGSLQQDISPGNLTRLLAYQNTQAADQHQTSAFCHHLVQLFSREDKASVLARNLGLLGLDALAPVKSRFAQKAMGL